MHQPKKLDCGLIKGKFVNNRALSSGALAREARQRSTMGKKMK